MYNDKSRIEELICSTICPRIQTVILIPSLLPVLSFCCQGFSLRLALLLLQDTCPSRVPSTSEGHEEFLSQKRRHAMIDEGGNCRGKKQKYGTERSCAPFTDEVFGQYTIRPKC